MKKNIELLPKFVLNTLRDNIRSNDISVRFLSHHTEEEIVNEIDFRINEMYPDELLKEWLDLEGIIGYEGKIKEAVSSIYQVKLTRPREKTWCCWVLSEEEIIKAINDESVLIKYPTFGLEVSAENREAFINDVADKFKDALSVVAEEWESDLRICVKRVIEEWDDDD